jgi:WD40 repeat protein
MSGFSESLMGSGSHHDDAKGDIRVRPFAELEGTEDLVWTLGTWDHQTEEGSSVRIFASSSDHFIQIFDRETGTRVARLHEAGTGVTSVVVVTYLGGEVFLASGDFDGSVKVWSTSTNALVRRVPGPAEEHPDVTALSTYEAPSTGEPRLVARHWHSFSVIDPLGGTVSRRVTTSAPISDTVVYSSSRGEHRVACSVDCQVGCNPE